MGIERSDDQESQFLSSLEDVLAILLRLGSTCTDLGELTELVSLAVGNEQTQPNRAQLKILMAIVQADPARQGQDDQRRAWPKRATS